MNQAEDVYVIMQPLVNSHQVFVMYPADSMAFQSLRPLNNPLNHHV
jgi:hypothetical protein